MNRTQVNSLFAALLVGLAILVASGCGGSGTQVEGDVKLDGVAVDGGTISFFLANEQGKPDLAHMDIVAGRYAGPGPAPGSYRVQILWNKKNDKKVDPDISGGSTQVIPKKYNADSKEVVEVKAGSNVFNFDLKSK